jgi:hypothetical protein
MTHERFQSARDLAFALQAVATETRSGAAPAATPHGICVVPLVRDSDCRHHGGGRRH